MCIYLSCCISLLRRNQKSSHVEHVQASEKLITEIIHVGNLSFSCNMFCLSNSSLHKQIHEKQYQPGTFSTTRAPSGHPPPSIKSSRNSFRVHCHCDCCTVQTNMDTVTVSTYLYDIQNFILKSVPTNQINFTHDLTWFM